MQAATSTATISSSGGQRAGTESAPAMLLVMLVMLVSWCLEVGV